ncbi:MAG: DUF2029 domain-containing protein [Candidatus Obscuribacterales bacterium]|nr:DUF2029 domain-containing protein [Candidatus Obscuribacterales bacterium]
MTKSRNKTSFFVFFAFFFFVISQFLTFFLLYRAAVNIHWYFSGPRLDLTDFSQFYQAGQLIVSKQAHQVYNPDVQEAWCLGLIYPHIPVKGLFYNQSVPFLYLFCIPYGFLPYNVAYIAWCLSTGLMSILALALLLHQSTQDLKNRGLDSRGFICLFLAMTYSSIPAYLTVWHGQTTFLMVTCMALSMYFLLRGKEILCGVWLALSTVKPQYILLPMVSLLGLNQRKAFIALFLTEAALFALAGCFMGFDNILHYPLTLISAESSSRFVGVNPHVMASLRGLLSASMTHNHKLAMLITVLALFASLIPVMILGRKFVTAQFYELKRNFYLAFVYMLALVLSPHTHYFDCLLVAVPAALTIKPWLLKRLTRQEKSDENTSPEIALLISEEKAYKVYVGLLIAYPYLSWFYNFALGSMEAEGIAFLCTNIALTIALMRVLINLSNKAPK